MLDHYAHSRLNFPYYMTKCVNPALERVLSLCGADVWEWFRQLPRPKLRTRHIHYDTYIPCREPTAVLQPRSSNSAAYIAGIGGAGGAGGTAKQTSMDQFTMQGSCVVCEEADALPQRTLCSICSGASSSESGARSFVTLQQRLRHTSKLEGSLAALCHNCCGTHPQPALLFAGGLAVGPDSCEALACPVLFERARLLTRMEDYTRSVAELEAALL